MVYRIPRHSPDTLEVSLPKDKIRYLVDIDHTTGRLVQGFESVCQIVADMSQMAASLQPRKGPNGKYYCAQYDVGITFGETEIKAFIEWKENVCFLYTPSGMDF